MRLIVRIGKVDNDITSPDDLMRYDLDHLVGNFSHYPLDVADRSNDNVVENHSEPKLHRQKYFLSFFGCQRLKHLRNSCICQGLMQNVT